MKKSIFFSAMAAIAMTFMASCGQKTEATGEQPDALSVDTIIANPEAFVGDTVTVEGVVSHLCSHGGKKAFLLGSTDNALLRFEATPEMGGYFPPETIHKPLRITGVVVESRITEETVQQMEAQHAEQVKMIAQEQGQEQADAVDRATSGCDTERKAAGQGDVATFADQMANYRQRIADRAEKEGKPYLSSYYVVASAYEVLED